MKLVSDMPRSVGWTERTMPPTDAVLTCRDCGGSFTFAEEERRSFAALGHDHPPSRCLACRAARKKRQVSSGTRGAAPRFRELQQSQTTIICSSCGESAVVPFAAQAGRSAYCSACFQRHRRRGEV